MREQLVTVCIGCALFGLFLFDNRRLVWLGNCPNSCVVHAWPFRPTELIIVISLTLLRLVWLSYARPRLIRKAQEGTTQQGVWPPPIRRDE